MKRRQAKPYLNPIRLHLLASLRDFGQRGWKLASKKLRFISLLVIILVLILFIIVGTLLPSTQPFEGSLTLRSLTFTSNANQPLLKNTRQITQFSTIGILPLHLTGQFGGISQPHNVTELTLQPTDAQAIWQLEVSPGSKLEIAELRLASGTTVKQLSYDTYNKRLRLEIRPQKEPATLILNPSGPLKLSLQGYKLLQLPPNAQPTEFTWQPNNQLVLPIQNPIQLDLQLTKPSNYLFWGSLAVERVKFNEATVSEEAYTDNYKESTILDGTIRLADKSYTLENEQFLTFDPADSILFLLRLRLTDKTPPTLKTGDNKTIQISDPVQGLKVDISGKTKRIEVGLNEKLPVAKLQASLLEGFMSREVFIALIAFLSSLVMTLLGWLWEIATKENIS